MISFAAVALCDDVVEIRVEPGDTIIGLCDRLLEDPRQYRRIVKINRLANPDRIFPDQVLKIPVGLLKGVPLEAAVTFAKGDVEVRAGKEGPFRKLPAGTPVGEGSTLRTGPESGVEISYNDNAIFLLRQDSQATIGRARGKTGGNFLHQLILQAGRSLSRVRAATGKGLRFEIRTPSAETGARGTEFRVSIDGDGDTRVEVLEGTTDVAAMKKTLPVHENEGTLVREGRPPIPPRRLLPPPPVLEPRQTYKSIPFSLSFGPVEGAVAFRILLARDRDGKDIVKEEAIKPSGSFRAGEVDDGTYFLRAVSVDEIGLEGSSDPFPVVVRTNPQPPFVQSPVEGAEYRERTPMLSWLKVRDAARYHLQIAEDNAFSRIVEEKDDLRGESHPTGPLEYERYYSRIRSIARDGYEGEWSAVVSFFVIPPPPSPRLEQPLAGKDDVTFAWRSTGEGMNYRAQVASDEAFENILLDERTINTSITFKKPEKPGQYHVRVQSTDAQGYAGRFSPPQSFEIKRRFPYEVIGFVVVGIIVLLGI